MSDIEELRRLNNIECDTIIAGLQKLAGNNWAAKVLLENDAEFVRGLFWTSKRKKAEASNETRERAEMSDGNDLIDAKTLSALDVLHRASCYLRDEFTLGMPRTEAQANLGARAHIFNCSNLIFKGHGIEISREEVEGARILGKVAACKRESESQ